MGYDPQRHHRRSIRLKGYDYTALGAYFVTICTQDRVHMFGEVVDGDMRLNPYGRVVDTYWSRVPRHFPHVTLDAWVVMPNHVHGIIVINDAPSRVDERCRGRGEAIPEPRSATVHDSESPSSVISVGHTGIASPLRPHGAPSGSLGAIVGNFKSITTRRINRMKHTPGGRVWQRNYWERIIRDEGAYQRIQRYIENNPALWEEDQLHPDAPPNPFNQR
jgi:REP element-mobilizing transposase RayT